MTERALRVLALGKYGELAASSRQRLVQYRQPLAAFNIDVGFEPLLSNTYVRNISGDRGSQAWSILDAYLRRARRLLALNHFDVAWVQSDLLPYVPGLLEAALLHRAPPIVVDYDDAIFHNYDLHSNPLVRLALGRKMLPLLRKASAAMCGNEYLKNYIQPYCPRAFIVPTVVNTQTYVPRTPCRDVQGSVRIGWIGSPTTWTYVRSLNPILRECIAAHGANVRAIGVGIQDRTAGEFDYVDWTLETEVDEVRQFDIGIMPLSDDPWSRGKCGYKLIQYMACGVPVVASPVGVNAKIIKHGHNGFLAATESEWRQALATLIADPQLRGRMGAAGRALVVQEYSLESQAPRVADILRSAAAAADTRLSA